MGAWRRSPPLYFGRATERIPFAIRYSHILEYSSTNNFSTMILARADH